MERKNAQAGATPPLLQVIEATTHHLRSGHARNAILLLQELFVLFAVAACSEGQVASSSSLKTAADGAAAAVDEGAAAAAAPGLTATAITTTTTNGGNDDGGGGDGGMTAACGESTIGALVAVAGGVNPRFIISAAVAALSRAAESFPRFKVALAMLQPRFVWPRNRCVSDLRDLRLCSLFAAEITPCVCVSSLHASNLSFAYSIPSHPIPSHPIASHRIPS